MNGRKLIGPLAYQGKEGCQDGACRCERDDDGGWRCIGWHCSYCDEPCSSQGHRCDASEAILGAAQDIVADTEARDG